MGMINGPPIPLFDLASCESFVQRTIDRSGISYSASEREDLLAEGLAQLYALALKYRPLPEPPCGYAAWEAMTLDTRQAYAKDLPRGGRFSGFAAMFLPRRLGDYWHRSHPHHRYVTDPATGKRDWVYLTPMLSLDQLGGGDGEVREDHLLHARGLPAFCHTASIAFPNAA